jgi:large subunit ribosomal protein L31
MKKGIHPEYRDVLFWDVSCDKKFIIKSTIKADLTETFEGTEYPMVKLDISSESHPFYTGNQKIVDSEGRIEKFRKKFGGAYAAKLKK